MLRIGIVGAGIRGRLYARALAGMPGVEVVGLCDPLSSTRSEACAALGITVYETYQQLYQHSLDAVIVATPDYSHVRPSVAAAEAGLHLLVEKPLATTVESAREIRDAVRRAGVDGFVAFENRWSPTFQQVHQRVCDGDLGEVRLQNARLNNTLMVPTRMLSWAQHSSPAWFLMPHTVDMILWLSGARVACVQAQGVRGVLEKFGIDTLDGVQALLTLADGSVGSLESVWSLPESMPSVVDYKLDVIGTRSAAFVDHQDQMLHLAGESYEFPRTQSFTAAGQAHGAAAWMARSFALRLQGADENLPDVDHGCYVTEIVAAIHESLDKGSAVRLHDCDSEAQTTTHAG